MILSVRTDKPEAEVGVFDGANELSYIKWQAHRELELTLLMKIEESLKQAGITRENLSGVVVYEGPGSFTGLRIGFAVVNTLASELDIPNAVGAGENWVQQAIETLGDITEPRTLVPNYGGEANITLPKK